MDQRDLEQIDAFLGQLSKGSLFEYYELPPDAAADDVEQAIKRRRSWAQGQQANPKFREEAIWLIRNNALVRRVMVDEREEYLSEVSRRKLDRELDRLSTFIRGALLSGVLSPEGERAIRANGAELGLPEDLISQRIDKILAEVGARRADSPNMTLEAFTDYYGMLGLPAEATLEEIEAAHREQVRKARNLRDKNKASQLYEQLDQAWVHLSSKDRRAEYDRRWHMRKGLSEPPPEPIGYLPPPEGAAAAQAPPSPAAGPPPQREPPVQAPPAREPPAAAQPSAVQPAAGPPPAAQPPVVDPNVAVRPPRPPPDIKSTIPINANARSTPRKPPRLTISSPDVVQLKVGRKPAGHSFLVRNSGQGRMPGRVTSDRDWLVVMRPRLDADAHQQEIQLVIDPSKMPKSRASANVTVVTDHGDRRSITFEVERSAIPKAVIVGGVALLLVLAILVGVALGLVGSGGSAVGTLEVIVDPGADEILVDGKPAGSGARVVVRQGIPLDTPFKVAASLDGFAPAEKLVTVPAAGEREQSVRLVLKLTDPLDRRPDDSARYVEFKPDGDQLALTRRKEALAGCLRHARSQDALPPRVLVNLYFGKAGKLDFVEFEQANFGENPDALQCLRRQLRAVTYPTVEGGDYGLVRGYKIEATASGSG